MSWGNYGVYHSLLHPFWSGALDISNCVLISSLHHYMTSMKYRLDLNFSSTHAPPPRFSIGWKIGWQEPWSDCFSCSHIIKWDRWRHHSLIILCVASLKISTPKNVSITTLLEKWEGAGDMCNFHIRNGRMIFYRPVPGLSLHREKIRATNCSCYELQQDTNRSDWCE